jgi:RNA polymerase sigma factor (sigma-70 family)
MLAERDSTHAARAATPSSDPRVEAALFERVLARDLKAFESLYRLYHPRLARFLSALTRRPALVEEVLNDTLYAVWSRPDAFSGRSKLSTWIFAIAYRKAMKALGRREDIPLDERRAHETPSGEAGADQVLETRQTCEQLARAIDELTPEHRAVVSLCYFHEMPYREIAELMGCPVDTVKTRMFYARRHLRTRLSDELSAPLRGF